jgi:hypothetical protein
MRGKRSPLFLLSFAILRLSLSVLTLLELAHGAPCADTLEGKSMREQFIK